MQQFVGPPFMSAEPSASRLVEEELPRYSGVCVGEMQCCDHGRQTHDDPDRPVPSPRHDMFHHPLFGLLPRIAGLGPQRRDFFPTTGCGMNCSMMRGTGRARSPSGGLISFTKMTITHRWTVHGVQINRRD
jgi:hypothetical protein